MEKKEGQKSRGTIPLRKIANYFFTDFFVKFTAAYRNPQKWVLTAFSIMAALVAFVKINRNFKLFHKKSLTLSDRAPKDSPIELKIL